MEEEPRIPRHRFLMDELVKVAIEGTMYRGIVRGIHAPGIEVSQINPYGICANSVNVIHSDTYTVIFYEPKPSQVNPYEDNQAADVPQENNNAQWNTHGSNPGILIRYAIDPDQFNANQSLPRAAMPRGPDHVDSNAHVIPYTMILYGIIPDEINTYFNNTYPMARFGISPNSISTSGGNLHAEVPFGTEPDPGVYHLLPRCDIITSYLVDIQHRLQIFHDIDEDGNRISWLDWVDDTSLGYTVIFEDRLREASNADEQEHDA